MVSLVLSCPFVAAQQAPADFVLFNGKIFTSDAARTYVGALAIRGERIIAIGDSAAVKTLAGPKTRQIDLGGRTVIPGINDAHMHIEVLPASRVTLAFKGQNPTVAEVNEAIASAVIKAPKGTMLYGDTGPIVFHDERVTRDNLDKIAPNNPVILATFGGHSAILNSAALTLAGLKDGQADPVGGRYERTADGWLTGVLREYATLRLARRLSDLTSDEDAVAQFHQMFQTDVRFGITSLQNMSDAMSPERCVALLEKAKTPIRVRVIRMALTTPAGRDTQEGRSMPRNPAPLITVSGVKWMLDGIPVEKTYTPRQGGAGESSDHIAATLPLTFADSEIKAILRESEKNDDQLLLHIVGYPSTKAVLTYMAAQGGKQAWARKRVRFEHGEGVFPDLLPEAKEMGVVVVQNPLHLGLRELVPDAFREPQKLTQPLRSLLDAGIPLAIGSDGPPNPYLNILFASTHPDRPSEAITREQAVTAYTLTAAYAEFAEKDLGSLVVGKLADLAVLSQDIFTVAAPDLPKTESVLTMVGGTIVYDAQVVHTQ
jgi:predicted amidohydrolase YtcJ